MDPMGVMVAIAGGAVAFVVIWRCVRWAEDRFADRLAADILAQTTTPEGRPKMRSDQPESDFRVAVSEADVVCTRPGGKVESVQWSDLQRVEILTTDEGPFAPDMFWVLHGSEDKGCVIPWGATGEKALMDRLFALPGFRSDVIVNAASLTTNNLLLCWERTPQDAQPR